MFDFTVQNKSTSLIKEFPEIIPTKNDNRAKLDSPRILLTECEDKIAVGVTVNARVRVFTPTENGLSVTENCQNFGEFEYVPSESTINDIINVVNNIVDKVLKSIEAWG
jgi:hypothetical protein